MSMFALFCSLYVRNVSMEVRITSSVSFFDMEFRHGEKEEIEDVVTLFRIGIANLFFVYFWKVSLQCIHKLLSSSTIQFKKN